MKKYNTGIFIEGYVVDVTCIERGDTYTASIDGILYVSTMAGSLSEALSQLKAIYLRVREVTYSNLIAQFDIQKAKLL